MKIAIIGATGFVGRHLVAGLVKAGYEVRCLVHRRHTPDLFPANIEVVSADIHDRESLVKSLNGCDVVYHLVGIIAETRELTFQKTVIEGTANLIYACQKNNIKQIIYLSGLGTSADGPTAYFRSKWLAEESIRNCEIDFSIIRSSVIFGPDDQFINQLIGIIKRAPLTPILGSGDFILQPIYIFDLVDILMQSISNAGAANKTIDCSGPEIFSYKELIIILKRYLNIKRLNIYLPMWLMRVMAGMIELVIKPAPITRDQLKMLEIGSSCNNDELLRIFDVKLTSLEEKLKLYKR